MNSKQRRGKRVFVHEVVLHAGSRHGERYFEFDRRVAEAKGWLQWRAKRKHYTLGPRLYDQQTFKFRDGRLAVAFALKFT